MKPWLQTLALGSLAMLTFARWLTNLVYLVPLQVRRYRERHPEAEILAAGATKARQLGEPEAVRRGWEWIVARRSTLILTRQELVCRDWVIPLAEVTDGTIGVTRAGALLSVTTADGGHYQFGLTRDPAWTDQDSLPLRVEELDVQWSAFSIALRVVLIALLVAFLVLR